MKQAIRRLTIYPGQISMVFQLRHAEKFFAAFMSAIPNLPDSSKDTVIEFLGKMESAICTGRRLCDKQSTLDKRQ